MKSKRTKSNGGKRQVGGNSKVALRGGGVRLFSVRRGVAEDASQTEWAALQTSDDMHKLRTAPLKFHGG